MATEPGPEREEIRHRFEESLDAVRRDSVALGSLVLENARRATEAMLNSDLGLAQRVVEADEEVNERYSELERRVFEILARQQPVAGDLRFLVSVTRMLYEIERTGDLVVNCATSLQRTEGFELSPATRGLLARVANEACRLWSRGLDVLADLDAEGGAGLEKEDDVVDDLVGEFFEILAAEAEMHGLETAIQMSRIGRYLERIADHAVNIGQHVTYIVTGSFPGDARAAD